MRILVGFEESGIVSAAFRARGHEAWSCDLLPTRGDPKFHFQENILRVLHRVQFDLWILHPPCTATCVSGNGTYAGTAARDEACKFVRWLYEVDGPPRAIEQPITVLGQYGMKPTQYIHPWQFGHGETKKTALYLRDLPPLVPTNIVAGRENRVWKMTPGPLRARARSETYQGIAGAMADQWGGVK